VHHLVTFTPADLQSGRAAAMADPEAFRWRLLAQGDSWFATGTERSHGSLLPELVFEAPAAAVNCAVGGEALRHMVDLESAPDFVRLLIGPGAPVWDGILLSCGGNDLIAAAATAAQQADGGEVPLSLRLLRRQTEWGPPSAGVARYFSEEGWATYAEYLRANVRHLLSLRDQGPSAGKPVFMHCYAVPMPRPAGAETGAAVLGSQGPWLYPAVKAYALPQADWAAISRLMVFRLAQALKAMAADQASFPGLQVFDSTLVPLALANPGAGGSSGDWHNEIQLNHSGSFKIGRAWSEHIGAVFNPPPPVTGRKSRGN
jgi:hypothetical protein